MNHFIAFFLVQVNLLFFSGWLAARYFETDYLLQYRPSLIAYSIPILIFSVIFAGVDRLIRLLIEQRAFARPRAILWFQPLIFMMLILPSFVIFLWLLPLLTDDLIFTRLTGLDVTRFQQLVRLVYGLLLVDCLATIIPAIHHYLRYHVIIKVPGANPPWIHESARGVISILGGFLVVLLIYTSLISPDTQEWWKIRAGWRFNRNALSAIEKTGNFLAEFPDSRYIENGLFFLGNLRQLHLNDATGAVQVLERLDKMYPDSLRREEAALLLAEAEKTRGNWQGAGKVCLAGVAARPAGVLTDDLLLLAAEILVQQEETSEARLLLLRLKKDFPEGVRFLFDREDRCVGRESTFLEAERLLRKL